LPAGAVPAAVPGGSPMRRGPRPLVAAVWTITLLPGLWLGVAWVRFSLGAADALGPDPLATLEHETGLWALRWLLLALAISPLAAVLKGRVPAWPVPGVRRALGLAATLYAIAHFGIYLSVDLAGEAAADQRVLPLALAADLAERPFILVGMLALLLMLALAVTSTQAWQRRLKRQWKRLHRLVYPLALLAVLHFFWAVKLDLSEPLFYAAVLLLLLGWRWPGWGLRRGGAPRPSP